MPRLELLLYMGLPSLACCCIVCIVDGGWSEWNNWSECPKSCGGAIHFRTRKCDNPRPDHGGRSCADDYREFEQCNTQLCPGAFVMFKFPSSTVQSVAIIFTLFCYNTVNGNWAPWSEWSHCSTSCDRGGRNRTRECNNPRPKYDGDECPGRGAEWQPCFALCPGKYSTT